MRGLDCQAVRLALRKYALYGVVVALGLGWYGRMVWRQHQAVEAILAAGGRVTYDLYGSRDPVKSWRKPLVVRSGQRHFWYDLYRTPTDAQAVNCRDGDLLCKSLARLPHLRFLKLQGSRVTDEGLASLAGLRRLEALNCNGATLTDAGMEHIAGMPRLWQLMLSDTQVSDHGMAHLMALSRLRWLAVERTQVSEAGIKRLQLAVPSCGAVVYSPSASADALVAD